MKKILLIFLCMCFIGFASLYSYVSHMEVEDETVPDQEISQEESQKPLIQFGLEKYFDGIVQVDCKDSSGSGSAWRLSDGEYAILTNWHVVTSPIVDGDEEYCHVYAEGLGLKGNKGGIYKIYPSEDYFEDMDQDIALMPIHAFVLPGMGIESGSIEGLNYLISTLPNCPQKTTVGSPVYVIGYPASGSLEVEYAPGRTATQDFKIVTEGIVSGHDTSVTNTSGSREIPDYFVSAKIDAGNSGGVALSEDGENICILGIPTWVNVGEYDTQGVIQNINSIQI